ncbi:MAG: class I SAM-dependent methyltransferase [Planctomycetes bacterium]|nr:class I SAM-dependent methyltransferase [Planctomycetota bacterium]
MWIAEIIMQRRALRVLNRIREFLPSSGIIADVGSGTGHNADAIRKSIKSTVTEFDVVDIHWVGPGPQNIADSRIPADDQSFDATLLLYVLQYPEFPDELLLEVNRISRGTIVVLQSTYRGILGWSLLTLREFVFGRMACRLAIIAKLIRPQNSSLIPRRYFRRVELETLFEKSGFSILDRIESRRVWIGVSRDLYLLRSKGR